MPARARLADEMGASPTMAMAAPERAAVDARRIPSEVLSMLQRGDVTSPRNVAFVRSFAAHAVPAGERANFMTADGELSLEGATRVRNALTQRAYGSNALVTSLAEHADPVLKAFGGALIDAAGPMAKLRGAIESGAVSPSDDITGALVEAARVIQTAKRARISLADAVAQTDAFGKRDPLTETVLRATFGDDLSGRMSRPKLAGLLSNFAEELQVQSGLLGENKTAAQVFEEMASRSLASRSARLYNPPDAEARPIEADYPSGAPTDASGRITADIDGRPLGAGTVVGRRTGGAPDVAVPKAGIDAIAEALPGASLTPVSSRILRGDAGRFRKTIDPKTGQPLYDLQFDKSLSAVEQERVLTHEFGHAVDEIAGQIPGGGLSSELKQVYNALNNPNAHYQTKLFGPENMGYSRADVPRELMAEAVRAYMTNPNWLKTVAPKTAATIRAYVNDHPVLSKVIQFNVVAGLGIALGSQTSDVDQPDGRPRTGGADRRL